MRATWTAIAIATGLGLSAMAAGSANAAVTFNFTGDCADCGTAGPAGGTLTLQNMPNGAISKADFVSFVYSSSLVSFQIKSTEIIAVMGSIDPNDLGKSYIDIVQLGGTGWEFERNSDGTWSVYSEITGGQSHAPSGGGGGGGGGGGFGGAPDLGSGDVSTINVSSGGDDFVITRINDDTSGPNGGSQLTLGVPEPATWAMMLVGFGGMGAMLRNRRRSLRGIETA